MTAPITDAELAEWERLAAELAPDWEAIKQGAMYIVERQGAEPRRVRDWRPLWHSLTPHKMVSLIAELRRLRKGAEDVSSKIAATGSNHDEALQMAMNFIESIGQ